MAASAALSRFDQDWAAALQTLSPEMHPVDRDACLLWFQFFPLTLFELHQRAPDRAAFERFYQLRGSYRLSEIADTSHRFLYGHRYWPEVKNALHHPAEDSLTASIRAVASRVSAPSALTLAIAAIGWMTLRQAGPGFLNRTVRPPVQTRTPEQVLQHRTAGLKSGWLSKPKPRVLIDENQADGWFPLLPGQHLTTAAERDKRPHHQTDPRCTAGNGPIPVDCRSGTCGTCWVGILGGNQHLSPVEPHERKRIDYFGYWETPFHPPADPKPLIRLACQTVARGTCSIVIPPWNAVWGPTRQAAFPKTQKP